MAARRREGVSARRREGVSARRGKIRWGVHVAGPRACTASRRGDSNLHGTTNRKITGKSAYSYTFTFYYYYKQRHIPL